MKGKGHLQPNVFVCQSLADNYKLKLVYRKEAGDIVWKILIC